MTYTINETNRLFEDLQIPYCNRFNCKNTKLEFLQKDLFIEIAPIKDLESDWE